MGFFVKIMGVFCLLFFSCCDAVPWKKMEIISAVADLRGEPVSADKSLRPPVLSEAIGSQLSQLLYGEKIFAKELESLFIGVFDHDVCSEPQGYLASVIRYFCFCPNVVGEKEVSAHFLLL